MSFKVEGVHHIGITVRNMQRSFDWYTKMFGLEPGPVNHGEGKELSDAVTHEKNRLLDQARVAAQTQRVESADALSIERERAKTDLVAQVDSLAESMVQHLLKGA